MQIKTTLRYCLTHVRMAIFNTAKKKGVGEAMEKREPLYTVDGSVNWYSHNGKQYGGCSKIF